MRLENAGATTWLLAGVAGWALLAWLLAAAGMGGRIEPLPDDPSLLKPLPAAAPASASRLGSLDQYAEIAARPLFSPDRQPQPFFLQGEGEQADDTAFDYVLTSVLITPGTKLAIIQPPDGSESVRVRLDQAPESHPAWRLIGISPRSAVFEGPEGQRNLVLRVFDGEGGAAPTPQQSTDAGAQRRDGRAASGGGQPAAAESATPAPVRDETGSPATARDAAEPEQRADPPPPPPKAEQMEEIRRRIQARRAQLRGEPPPPPPANSR